MDNDKNKKLKMSNSKFRTITIPITSLVLVLTIGVSIAMNVLDSTLDTFFGKGERHTVTIAGQEDWDTKYYGEALLAEKAKEEAYAVSAKLQDEGTILLKNNGALPLAKGSIVMPFGYAYENPIYGQLTSGGSAKWAVNPITPADGLKDYVTIDTSAIDKLEGKPEELEEAPGTTSASVVGSVLGGNSIIYEYDPSSYNSLPENKQATGLVFISRAGQEGSDKKHDAYIDGTPHYLALSENEKGAIRAAKKACGKVVVIFVSSAPMELAPLIVGELEADAILWYGHPGDRGFSELGKILTGEVNPSGRTVDIFSNDFTKNPTYVNFGPFVYSNATIGYNGFEAYPDACSDGQKHRFYIEYQEDMYMGYRYYETADVMDDDFVYEDEVVFPFGYGLSYSTFTQEITRFKDSGDEITVTVKVSNTSDVPGKEVVQLYYTSPYTDFDIENEIEKPAKNLVAFDKVEVKAKDSAEVELSFAKEDMASYCDTRENPDGTIGSYVLEKGDYTITLGKNSHEVWDSEVTTIGDTIWYDSENPRQSEIEAQAAYDEKGTLIPGLDGKPIPAKDSKGEFQAASNLFQDSTDYMHEESSFMTRSNWEGSYPKNTLSKNEKNYFVKTLKSKRFIDINSESEDDFEYQNDPMLGNVEESLVYNNEELPKSQDNGLTVSSLRGKDYYDEEWDLFLNQVDWNKDTSEFIKNVCFAAYRISEMGGGSILPSVEMYDGINGLKLSPQPTNDEMTQTSSIAYAPLMAATWNQDLVYEMGKAIGKEALAHNVNGWYAPAINLHRSPFGGRVFEYYSEDPVLTGKIAASIVSGAGDSGLVTYIKHFALNDEETSRSMKLATWAREQTMRELYLKPFEIAVKEAKMTIRYTKDTEGNVGEKVMRAATGIMSAQTCIGATQCHASYALQTELLRNEWGFNGTVTSDYYVYTNNAVRDKAYRSGCDLWLCTDAMSLLPNTTVDDMESNTAKHVYRNMLHNIAYTLANSNAMQGVAPGSIVYYDISPWKIGAIVGVCCGAVLTAGGIGWNIWRTLDEKRHPEKYTRKQKKA